MATKPTKRPRVTDRAKRRLMVKYGKEKADRTAFTRNISPTGVFLQTNSVFPPGETIVVELHFPDQVVKLNARVAWAKKVPAQLAHVLDCGMGIRFLDPDPDWPRFFSSWQQKGK